ncbi:MAG: hypothetical protein ABIF10_04115 [Candidatus Woesearchaeota archaeon]
MNFDRIIYKIKREREIKLITIFFCKSIKKQKNKTNGMKLTNSNR